MINIDPMDLPTMQDAMQNHKPISLDCRAWLLVLRATVRRAAAIGIFLTLAFHTMVCLGQERQRQGKTALQAGDINTDFSRVYIFVDRTTALGHAHGVEGRLRSGNVMMNNNHLGVLVFDMKSFDADTPTGRKVFGLADDIDPGTRKKVNENMLGAEILDANKYPEAKLENVKLTATGKISDRKLPEYVMEGDFTLHSTTRKISAICDFEEKNGWNHLRGKFRIRQTDYGIKPYTRALGAVGIKDELLIFGDLWIAPSP